MAPKQPTTTTQISKVELPEWVNKASESNYKMAEEIAAKPFEQYGGKTVADVSSTTTDAYDRFKAGVGGNDSAFAKANELFEKQGRGVLGLDRAAYTNPFIDQVENKALSALDKSRIQSLMSNADKAVSSKAFGGSRSAIVDALTNSESAEKAGVLSAGLRKEGFDQATGAMRSDLAGFGSGAQGILGTAEMSNAQRLKDFSGLLGIGQQEQSQAQRLLDDSKGRFDEAKNSDLEKLNIKLSALGMSPYGKSENTQKTTSGGSSGTDFAQMGLGILSLLFGLSDKTEKTDIRRVGKHKETGIPLYSFRYKGDPKRYPKVVGPMAQDVKKVFPKSVVDVGGKLAVDKRLLGALSGVKA
jgi:hypothetical protein